MTGPPARGGPWWAAREPILPDAVTPCVVCGAPLDMGRADEQATPASAMCGDCTRARDFDQTLWELDLAEPDAALW